MLLGFCGEFVFWVGGVVVSDLVWFVVWLCGSCGLVFVVCSFMGCWVG